MLEQEQETKTRKRHRTRTIKRKSQRILKQKKRACWGLNYIYLWLVIYNWNFQGMASKKSQSELPGWAFHGYLDDPVHSLCREGMSSGVMKHYKEIGFSGG